MLSDKLSPNNECRYAECRYAECCYAECCFAECRGVLRKCAHYAYFIIVYVMTG
jgi:hypothetical protein